ncbi:MAG: cell division protein ZapB [Thermoanaerobaculia bacterium]
MSLEFLEILEARIHEAVERIEELAAENEGLRAEIEKLERERAAAPKPKPARGPGKAEKAWAKERDEIRQRLETLVEKLSALLETA